MKQIIIALLAFGSAFAQSTPKVGGACTYTTTNGTATITEIIDAPSTELNCDVTPKKITFKFTPKGKKTSSISTITINSGYNPSQTWVTKNKLVVGKKIVCKQKNIKSGTCTPVVYEFVGLNTMPKKGCN